MLTQSHQFLYVQKNSLNNRTSRPAPTTFQTFFFKIKNYLLTQNLFTVTLFPRIAAISLLNMSKLVIGKNKQAKYEIQVSIATAFD